MGNAGSSRSTRRKLDQRHDSARSTRFPPGNTCNALDRDGPTRSRDDAPSTVSYACWSLAAGTREDRHPARAKRRNANGWTCARQQNAPLDSSCSKAACRPIVAASALLDLAEWCANRHLHGGASCPASHPTPCPPRSQGSFQSLKPQELWEHLPERPRIAILATLVRIVSSLASPDHQEVTHEDS